MINCINRRKLTPASARSNKNRSGKIALAVVLLLSGFSATAQSAHANIDYVISKLPEFGQMKNDLAVYQKQLQQKLQELERKSRQELESLMQRAQRGELSAQQEQDAQEKLGELERQIRAKSVESEQNMLKKRNELLQPILKRVEKAVKQVAAQRGFTRVFKSEALLYAPDAENISDAVVRKLNAN